MSVMSKMFLGKYFSKLNTLLELMLFSTSGDITNNFRHFTVSFIILQPSIENSHMWWKFLPGQKKSS